jgi:hypothetical protein
MRGQQQIHLSLKYPAWRRVQTATHDKRNQVENNRRRVGVPVSGR